MAITGSNLNAAMHANAETDTNYIQLEDGTRIRASKDGYATAHHGDASITVRLPGQSSGEVLVDGAGTAEEAHVRNVEDRLGRQLDQLAEKMERWIEPDPQNPGKERVRPGFESDYEKACRLYESLEKSAEYDLSRTAAAAEAAHRAEAIRDANLEADAEAVDDANEQAILNTGAPAVSVRSERTSPHMKAPKPSARQQLMDRFKIKT